VMTALGNSVATPAEGLEAEIAYYADLAALRADSSERARGRIVFIDQKTERRRFGANYGSAVAARARGASEAAKRGAIAVAIRSIGTDHDRLAHTGSMTYDKDVAKIPAVAVSIPDADLIARLAASGPVRLRIAVASETDVPVTSHNVIGEVPGGDLAEEIVMIGAHLDSWDLGTGAIDDGAGVGIVVAAAKAILDAGARPRRTIRVVLFGNEENGLDGAKTYAERYKAVTHQLVGESDFGAGRPWRIASHVLPSALPVVQQIQRSLASLDLSLGDNGANTGADANYGVTHNRWPTVHPDQDGADYFNFHHTANDTLDKIDPATLPPNVAAWAVIAWLAAQSDIAFGPLPPAAAPQPVAR
jgi:carboxypeptidase Q